MLHVLLAILTAGSPSPSPSPTAAPETLKTIITLKSSPLCSAFAAHANAAIDSTVRNDAALSAVVGALRTDSLGENDLTRLHEEHRLSDLADSIYRDYRNGMKEVNHLRDLVKTATTNDEKVALKDSADALGGALYRQHLIQRDLDGFVAYLDAADMRTVSPDDARNDESISPDLGDFAGYDRERQLGSLPPNLVAVRKIAGEESREDDVRMSIAASRDFQQRIPAIIKDEMTAARRFDEAGSGC